MRKAVRKALLILNEAGQEAFIVGGAVRDKLLNKKIKDYDIATSATPEEIKEIFSAYKTIDIGKKYGTTIVLIDNFPIEITPYRLEEDYYDHRHPSKVTYTYSLFDDLKRRDFTINALCLNYNNELIDLFNGKEDLDKKIIRCIGDPDQRFKEDALRILRAIRFSSNYNFSIEKNTLKALFDNAELLNYISIERKRDELLKILDSNSPSYYLNKYHDILKTFINFKKCSNRIDNFSSPYFKLAYLLKDDIKQIEELKLANDKIKLIYELDNANRIRINNDKSFINLFSDCIYENEIIKFLSEKYQKTMYFRYHRLKKYMVNKKNLDIKGKDLIALGYHNKDISLITNEIIEKIRNKKLKNNHRDIIKYLKER